MELSPFTYQPVQSSNNEIRILFLKSARSFNSPIHCDIKIVNLEGKVKYEALSYTWGTENNLQKIFIQGQPFLVRENLYAALKRLRMTFTTRSLWIDAICIDQNNITEKEFQLPLMTKIYEGASQVCVWLGEASDLSAVALKGFSSQWSVQRIRANRRHGYLVPPFRERMASSEAIKASSELFKELDTGELRELLSRPYWTRVWIMQEAIVAKKLLLICGGDAAPWEGVQEYIESMTDFRGAIQVFGITMNPEFDLLDKGYSRIEDLRQRWQEKRWDISIYEILYEFRQLDCSNPNDRVYGFLGLVGQSLGFKITPRYMSSTEHVYMDLAQTLIVQRKTLDILNCVRESHGVTAHPSQKYAYSLIDQARYHDTECMVKDAPERKARKGWVRLPPGWERIEERGGARYFYNWNNKSRQDHSPYRDQNPQKPQVVLSQRPIPDGWSKSWNNLGVVELRYGEPQTIEPVKELPSATPLQLPSWVPNWAMQTPWDPAPLLDWSDNHPRYWAGGNESEATIPNLDKASELNLSGMYFDKISLIGDAWHPIPDYPPVSCHGIMTLIIWAVLAETCYSNEVYGDEKGLENALWRTFIADYAGDQAAPDEDQYLMECWYDKTGWKKSLPDPNDYAGKGLMDAARLNLSTRSMKRAMWKQYLNVSGRSDELGIKGERFKEVIQERYGEYAKRIHRVCAHRSMFVTRKGYIGLAPWNAKHDAIFVFPGGKTPYILREAPETKTYSFVGEAFVYGIMGGEALEMDLPVQNVHIT